MPKLVLERLTPSSIVTYILDKQAKTRFHARNYYHTHTEKKPKKEKTEDEKKEKKSISNKKYREKMKEKNKFICQCGSELRNTQYYIKRHFKSHIHQRYIKNHGDIIEELD